jgi:hypothetical protein
VRRAAALLLVAGCSGVPLPADLGEAQRQESAHDAAGALEAYRAVRGECEQTGRMRPHDDCALAAVREAELLERQGRWAEAREAWLRVPPLSTDARKQARALERAASLSHSYLSDPERARALAWTVVERYPDEVPADDALALAVRLDQARDPAALARRLDALWPQLQKREVGDNLLFARAELTARLGDPSEAVAAYDLLADTYLHSGLRDDSLWRAAALARRQRDFTGALRRLQRILDTHKDALITGSYNSLVLDDAELLTGRIYLDDLHDPERALVAFQNLVDDFPDSTLRDDGLYELARACLARHAPPTSDDRARACAALARLERQFPDGNRVRAARALQAELSCR